MAVMEICCQDIVAVRVEYDHELHVFTRVIDVPHPRHVPIAAQSVDGTVTKGRLTKRRQDRAIPVTRDGYEQLRGDLFGTDRMSSWTTPMGCRSAISSMRPDDSDVSWRDVNFFDND